MQYSPKLKSAMEKIVAILKENDIAGFIVLHDKGSYTEWCNHLVPSYSVMEVAPGSIRIQQDLKTKFGGDHDKFLEAVDATGDMLYCIAKTAIRELGPISATSHMMDEHFGLSHKEARTTTNDETFN